VSLREIRRYQKSTELLLRKGPFAKLVRERTHLLKENARFEMSSMGALQEFVEMQVVKLFEKSQLLAVHGKRVTVFKKDISTAKVLTDSNY